VTDRSRTRRERTFVGSECAVCEEPLEHTLRGERILQFSCAHVSHEACFYEFIRELESQYCPTCDSPLHLDSSRAGNVLDIGETLSKQFPKQEPTVSDPAISNSSDAEKITNLVRSASSTDYRSQNTATPTPASWDREMARGQTPEPNHRQSAARDHRGTMRDSRDAPSDRHGQQSDRHPPRGHARSDSEATGATGVASSGGYPETMQSGPPRRHDYDLQAMETTPGSPRPVSRNPIPPPSVTVRSEFPTLNKSRQQQTLTCLITVEVTDNKWRADPEDLGMPPAAAPPTARIEESHQPPPSPVRSAPRFYPYESPEVLEEMTETLRNRVDNWHGLDFSR
ncbi:hypothetical protein IMZ48_04950, partial [Candidatus Bathyarchaeota archaeon]|nr:hypothetical protein [Candidatus Bathyarchaeota archaeon]